MGDIVGFVIALIIDLIEQAGYFGIFILMAIESSVIPLPSEVVMIPAGYLVYLNKMNMTLVILAGTLGSLAGALINYFIAMKLGRPFIRKYGKYFLLKAKSIEKTEVFFNKHGEISTFVGRLIPLIRHYISLPAGLAKMNLLKFSIYTLLGALIWVSILSYFGYYLGASFEHININEIANAFGRGEKDATQSLIKAQMSNIVIFVLVGIALISFLYIVWQFFRKKR